jgi:16S rRNA C1402 N4-methylase RsmH
LPVVTLARTSYGGLAGAAAAAGFPPLLHGVLADLGVSSWQLDSPHRGFSLRADRDGPLDMRFHQAATRQDGSSNESALAPVIDGPSAAGGAVTRAIADTAGRLRVLDVAAITAAAAPATVTAADLVNQLPEAALARLFASYGEERQARRVAAAIAARRARAAFATTGDLAAVVAAAVRAGEASSGGAGGSPGGGGHPATRVFQALRIAVNGELAAVAGLLDAAPRLLAPGGRLAVITFHSLEDRAVKRAFARWASPGRGRGFRVVPAAEILAHTGRNLQEAGHSNGEGLGSEGIARVSGGSGGRGAVATGSDFVEASAAEAAANPRARSARLRVLERRHPE